MTAPRHLPFHPRRMTLTGVLVLAAIGLFVVTLLRGEDTRSKVAGEARRIERVKVIGSPCRTVFRLARQRGKDRAEAAIAAASNPKCLRQGSLNRLAVCRRFPKLADEPECRTLRHYFDLDATGASGEGVVGGGGNNNPSGQPGGGSAAPPGQNPPNQGPLDPVLGALCERLPDLPVCVRGRR